MASQYNKNNLTNQATLAIKRESGEITRVADLTEKNKLKMRELLKAEQEYNILKKISREDLIKINQKIKPMISTIIEEFINFKSQSNISSDETKIIDLIYTNVNTLLTFKLIDFKTKENIDLVDIILKNLKSLELKIDVSKLSRLIYILQKLYIKIIREFYYSEELKKKHTQLRTELRKLFKLNGGGNPSMNNIIDKDSLYTKAEELLLDLNLKDKNKYYNKTYKDSNGKLVTSYSKNDLILYSPENIKNLITVIEKSYNEKSSLKKVLPSKKPKLIKMLDKIYTLKLQEKSLNNTNLTEAQLELELEEFGSNSTTNNLTAAELAELYSNSPTNNLTEKELLEQLEEEVEAERARNKAERAIKKAERADKKLTKKGGSLKKTKKVKKSNKKSKTLKK